MKLAKYITLEEKFARSTNIALDFTESDRVADYKFTAKSINLVTDIIYSYLNKNNDRSYSIIGPYGSGKSTFGLFITQLLTEHVSKSNPKWIENGKKELKNNHPAVFALTKQITTHFVPILVVGSKGSLSESLFNQLLENCEGNKLFPKSKNSNFHKLLKKRLSNLKTQKIEPVEIIELITKANDIVIKNGKKGLMIVLDEFGTFVETDAIQGQINNLQVAQLLAEFAASKKSCEVLVITILHQTFQNYFSTSMRANLNELSKIQGRFRQIDFNEDAENLYELVSSSMTIVDNGNGFKTQVLNWANKVSNDLKVVTEFNDNSLKIDWKELAYNVYPIHPMSLYCLVRFCTKFGQNERSMFSFLASNDPLNFKSFLNNTEFKPDHSNILTLDYLYDYFVTGSQTALLPEETRKSINSVEIALSRLGDRPQLETTIIKTIGVLSMLGYGNRLYASEITLKTALNIKNSSENKMFDKSIQHLINTKIIVYRKHSNQYHVWEGSDFDIDGSATKIVEDLRLEKNVLLYLNKAAPLQPMLANRYSYQNGTPRLFKQSYLTIDLIDSINDRFIKNEIDTFNYDGIIYYAIVESLSEIDIFIDWAKTITDPRTIVCIPRNPLLILDSTLDLVAYKNMSQKYPEINDDPVSSKELDIRIQFLSDKIIDDVQEAIYPNIGNQFWYCKAIPKNINSSSDLNRLISISCEEAYCKTPIIRNEIINRSKLSTPGVLAVKKIIAACLKEDIQENLGFEGNGPEVSITRALITANRLIGIDKLGNNTLLTGNESSDEGFRETWNHIESFFKGTEKKPKNLNELIKELSAAPYGIKTGLTNLLIWLVLIYHIKSVSLYETGTYLPQFSPEIFERFTKAPQSFSIRWLGYNKNLNKLLVELDKKITVDSDESESKTITVSAFLYKLFHWYRGLPESTKKTNELSNNSIGFRNALNSVSDPIELISEKIPAALDINSQTLKPTSEKKYIANYAKSFKTVINELSNNYQKLIQDTTKTMCGYLDCDYSITALKNKVKSINDNLNEHIIDPSIKSFVMRGLLEEEDETKYLESLIAVVANQPPRYWLDYHKIEFDDKMSLIALNIKDIEKRVYANSQFKGKDEQNIQRLAIETNSGQNEIYYSSDDIDKSIELTAKKIIESELNNLGDNQKRKQLALIKALELLIENNIDSQE